jgi:dipeptidyl aminopeptidase/acylaminoacyl peptidase
VISADGGTAECRTAGLKEGVGGGLQADKADGAPSDTFPVSADGQTAVVEVQIGGTVQIYRIALSGAESCTPLLTGDRDCSILSANARNLLYTVATMHTPGDLYVSDSNGANEKQLSCENDTLLAGLAPMKTEHLLFPGSDGAQVEGWLMLPAEGKAPFPTILYNSRRPAQRLRPYLSF